MEQIKIEFNERELEVAQKIALNQDISLEKVFIQALRIYQMVLDGKYELKPEPLRKRFL